MLNNHYNKIKTAMHTYSRSPIVEGQEFLDQNVVRAGHNVNLNEVRGQEYPIISSIKDRDDNFLVGVSPLRVVISKYDKVIKFLDKKPLKKLSNTNNEAFIVVDENDNQIKNFIDPSDRPNSNGLNLSRGYEIRIFESNHNTMISRNYGWNFDTFNGVLHFDSKFKPGCEEWNAKGFGEPLIEAFIYIGKSGTDVSNSIMKEIENTHGLLISIQPYKFSTSSMTKVSDPYLSFDSSNENGIYFQRLTFIVPGFCFEITSIDFGYETILTEMRHLPTGDTQIFIDVPWYIDRDAPIISQTIDEAGMTHINIGTYSFIATTFLKSNGERINVNNIFDFDENVDQIISPLDFSNYEVYNNGWEVPNDANYDININLNN